MRDSHSSAPLLLLLLLLWLHLLSSSDNSQIYANLNEKKKKFVFILFWFIYLSFTCSSKANIWFKDREGTQLVDWQSLVVKMLMFVLEGFHLVLVVMVVVVIKVPPSG